MSYLTNFEALDDSVVFPELEILDTFFLGVVRRERQRLLVVSGIDVVRIIVRLHVLHRLIRLIVLLGTVDKALPIGTTAIGDAHMDHLVEVVARQLRKRGILCQNRCRGE
jgi:hypothetical protein